MARKGRTVRTQVLEQELRAPTEQESQMLALTGETQVVALKRLRSVDGELQLLVTTAVPADLAPGLHRTRLENRSLYDAQTRELLGVTTQEPLLRIESVAYGANGRPLEHYQALHRCQASRLHVKTTT